MLLAVQIYAPLDDSPNHRTLYQFCCLDVQCHVKSEGWICLRDEVLDTSSAAASTATSNKPSAIQIKTNWVEDADDWGDEDDSSCHQAMETLSISTAVKEEKAALIEEPSAEVEGMMEESVTLDDAPAQPTVDIRALLTSTSPQTLPDSSSAQFSSFYLNVAEEQFSSHSSKLETRAKELLAEYQSREKCDWKKITAAKSSADQESYEKSRPSHGDELVHKFITRLQQSCPEQLVRYQRDGRPLLLKPLQIDKMPPCRHCDASLVFEMQLMPHLSQRLTLVQYPDNPNPIEVGTVIVFSCSKSCWDSGQGGPPRQEYLVVQADLI